MSNPDRLLREAQDHAETLVEDHGLFNALAWAIKCANRSTDGFWSRVVQAIEAIRDGDEEHEPYGCDDEPRDSDDSSYRRAMAEAGRGRLIR
jgi:hypothetical protein